VPVDLPDLSVSAFVAMPAAQDVPALAQPH
jgi:hypothetical protein